MDVITYALAKKMGGGGESITYTLTADTENKTIVLTPSRGTAQVITVPYATDASTVNGHEVPELENGKIPANYLPSFVDNVDEYDTISLFPVVGESNRIYIDKSTNKTYRWSGTAYVEISESIALGETSSTAYRGDRGKIAYDHSQSAHAPSNAEANQNAFSNVKIDSDTINASTKTDTLEFIAGDNIILTPNVSNKKITVSQAPVRKSASGDIASFSDGAGYPFLKVKANINPVQDLHGYDYPWVGGAGKNKFDIEGWFNSTGVSYTKTGNSYYLGTQLALLTQPYQFSDTDIAVSASFGSFVPDTGANPQLQLLDSAGNVVYQIRTSSSYSKYENIVASKIRLFWPNDGGGKFTLNEPQIQFGSTVTSYAPYSNICPISGFTGVNVTVSPTTTEGSGTVYPISWQDEAGIVYGGYIDLVSGVLTVTMASASLGARTWSTGETPSLGAYFYCSVLNLGIKKQKPYDQAYSNICSQYRVTGRTTSTFVDGSLCFDGNATTVLEAQIKDSRYTDATAFKTMLQETNAHIVYELATPQTYNLTPQQINTLIGQNNAWNNTNGQTEVEYKAPFYNDLTTKNEVQALINESITSALNASY